MAIIVSAKRLIFIHIPKTAGTTIATYLQAQHGGQRYRYLQHCPARDLPPNLLDGFEIVAALREPAAWYQSYWLHAQQEAETPMLSGGSAEFADWLYGATHPTPERCAETVGCLGPAVASREAWLVDGVGLWSQTMRYYLQDVDGRWLATRLLDVSDLESSLGRILDTEAPPPALRVGSVPLERHAHVSPVLAVHLVNPAPW